MSMKGLSRSLVVGLLVVASCGGSSTEAPAAPVAASPRVAACDVTGTDRAALYGRGVARLEARDVEVGREFVGELLEIAHGARPLPKTLRELEST